ncbi:MAG: hypothetical protein O2856_02345 [Planctomycetota bacterium]|nr:hypothetical protein [Planctomycetota bacterium]
MDVTPPINEEQSPAVAPETTSAEAETMSPFGNESALAPATE